MFISDINQLQVSEKYWFAHAEWNKPQQVIIKCDGKIRWHSYVDESVLHNPCGLSQHLVDVGIYGYCKIGVTNVI